MHPSNIINKIGICGNTLVTNDAEAAEAVETLLSWHGESEADRDSLEIETREELDPETDEPTGKWEIVPKWGSNSTATHDTEVIDTFPTEEQARQRCTVHNAATRAEILAGITWRTLPQPLAWLYFHGFKRGRSTNFTTASASARWYLDDGTPQEFTLTSSGRSPYIREIESPEALQNLLDSVVEACTVLNPAIA